MTNPIRVYMWTTLSAPVLFTAGIMLFFTDRVLGDPVKFEDGGAMGMAANLSMAGLTGLVRLIVAMGPQALILIGLAMPVMGALLSVDRMNDPQYVYRASRRKRRGFWLLACAETFLMLGLFVVIFEMNLA